MSQANQNSTEAVIERLRQIIANRLDANLTLEEIAENVPISEGGLGLDSIMTVEFIVLIEESFGFQFTEDELTSKVFSNLKTLAAFIAGRCASGGAVREADSDQAADLATCCEGDAPTEA